MSRINQQLLVKFQKRWQLLVLLKILMYALSGGLLALMIFKNITWALVVFMLVFILLLLLRKPWKISIEKTVSFLDNSVSQLENSTGLLLHSQKDLTGLAVLQQQKISKRLGIEIAKISPEVSLKAPIIFTVFCLIATVLVSKYDIINFRKNNIPKGASEESIVFQVTDTAAVKREAPVITDQQLTISYPSYTNLDPKTTTKMSVKALEGSKLNWRIQFNKAVDSVFMEQEAVKYPMVIDGNTYAKTVILTKSGFYNFKFYDLDGATYISDIYALELEKDAKPLVEIQNLKKFSTFEKGSNQKLTFSTKISDDFGIADAYIIATVTKGEGESVKFREERLAFNTEAIKGRKTVEINKTIDLKSLKMEAGDELYFYVEALDVKKPKPNRVRCETYFAVIRDTVTSAFAVEGTMGADLMPDYFRSQRQLIIDTEKLIADKGKISKAMFNSKSNELGYDQKALRLKYGQFMGDEADSSIQTQDIEVEEEHPEIDENNSVEEYTHDHDGANEHHIVDHQHDDEHSKDTEEDPLESYLHNHDDPEESTLFTQSLKGKLRQAMSEMWDAELHLRLYTPENSLVYQYRALKLIQEIKNSARIYVHRIGFDPPPIKEDKRLSGEINEVKTAQKKENIEHNDKAKSLRQTVARISSIITSSDNITKSDQQLFAAAGNELAQLAIENPSRYLLALQDLKQISESTKLSTERLSQIQSRLLKVLPKVPLSPSKKMEYKNALHTLILKELEGNE